MSELQSVTNQPTAPIENGQNPVSPVPAIDLAYTAYIDFCAVGGLRVTEDGDTERMSVADFCNNFGVSRMTIWRHRQADPNFNEKVAARRKVLFAGDHLSAVWRGVKLRAMRGDAAQATLYLANFDPEFKMPTQKVEHTDLGMADFLQIMRRRQASQGKVIEGEATETLPAGE
jgi:hypothetical protein